MNLVYKRVEERRRILLEIEIEENNNIQQKEERYAMREYKTEWLNGPGSISDSSTDLLRVSVYEDDADLESFVEV